MDEVDDQLEGEIPSSLPASRRFVAVLIDEMKVKEGLVFSKHSGEVIGFTKLGEINDELTRIEQDSELTPVAKHVLVLMVRGLLFRLNFPYAHFGTRDATGDILFPIIWEAIRRLEARELKVLCVTADGASPNRKFFKMNNSKQNQEICYKCRNFYSPDNRWLFFISDPPHLMKTVRNCWSHSGKDGSRHMKVQ